MSLVSGRSTRSTPGLREDIQRPPGATLPAVRQAFGGRLIVAPGLPGRKEHVVLGIKLRAGLLGLLAIALLGAFSAAPAFAEGGPWCHHREVGEKTEGTRITEAEPEEVAGHSAGEQRFKSKILGLTFTIRAQQAQVKGIIYNNEDQCQSKV